MRSPLDRGSEVPGASPGDAPTLERVGDDHGHRAVAEREVTATSARTGAESTAVARAEHRSPARRLRRIPTDAAICDECLAELFDPADRRFRHPFIACRNCGPGYTIAEDLPHERSTTTMREHSMCVACAAEYSDPESRRFRAASTSCPACGPTWTASRAGDPFQTALEALRAGEIVAIKGAGGYQLVCDARSDLAVRELRIRKHRPDEPFAVMVRDLEAARALVDAAPAEAALLLSPARPIVLCRARSTHELSAVVAPDSPLLGLVLPFSGLHHLLLAELGFPLVCTSANLAREPIAVSDDDLERSVTPLSDLILSHDLTIVTPCDDSVLRVVDHRLIPIRRARGYAPMPVPLADTKRPVVAVGGEGHTAPCVASRHQAWVGPHLGDMASQATQTAFARVVDGFTWMYDVHPTVVAVDAHPGDATSRWARRRHGPDRIVEVQHHHAHVASAMAEHGLDPTTPVVGIVLDGTGHGDDGTIWGGEVLVADATGYERVAHLTTVPLPGGDAAITNPYRVALAHLAVAGIEWEDDLAPVRTADAAGSTASLRRQITTVTGCVPTSSMGRLFDAVASLLDVRQRISYAAQAAMGLEHLATSAGRQDLGYRFEWDRETTGMLVFDAAPVIRAIVSDLRGGRVGQASIASGFHAAVVELVVETTVRFADRSDSVVLTGATFQNALLTGWCLDRLADADRTSGLTVLTHQLVPPNDGGLSLGQAFVAAHRPA